MKLPDTLFHPLFVCCWGLALAGCAAPGGDPAEVEPAGTAADPLGAAAQFVQPFFDELDCENVGYVQPEESPEHAAAVFSSFDVDRSRAVDRQEWLSYPFIRDKQLLAVSFEAADSNHDAVVDPREFEAYLAAAITLLDGDGDGEIHPVELQRNLRESSRRTAVQARQKASP